MKFYKNGFKYIVYSLLLIFVLSSKNIYAQMRIGQSAGYLDESAALEVGSGPYSYGSPYRGIVPPKVALSQTSTPSPIKNPAVGLLIFNIARTADVTPGYYYWSGSVWVRLTNTSAGLTAGDPLPAYTMIQLLNFTTPSTPSAYVLVIEPNREGLFRFDANSSEPTDGAMVVVTANGKRYVRVMEQDYNVMWWGVKGDGTVDESVNIQTAIDYIWSKGGGTLSFPSNKKYRIDNTVTVKQNVKLKGTNLINYNGNNVVPCQFIITTPTGIDTPAFKMASYSGMEGFNFYYPNQSPTSDKPTEYGWAITTIGSADSQDGIQLRNLMLQNPYLGINLDRGGQFIVENIYGNPIKTGLRIDRSYDVSRFNNIHFWNTWAGKSETASLTNWIKSNGTAYEIGHVDNGQFSNIMSYGYHTGMWLKQGYDGAPWIQVANATFDVADFGLRIDALYKAQFSNLIITGRNPVVSQDGIIVNSTVNGIDNTLDILGYQAANLVNAFRNKGVIKGNIVGSVRNTSNPVLQYEVINENDEAFINYTSPIQINNYSRIAGKVMINGSRSYDKSEDITPSSFSTLNNWTKTQLPSAEWVVSNNSNSTNLTVPGNTVGNLAALTFSIPAQVINERGLFALKIKAKVSIPTNGVGTLQFYIRLRSQQSGIYFAIMPVNNAFYSDAQTMIIPFVYSGEDKDSVFELIYGNNSSSSVINIEVENSLQLLKLSGYSSSYIEVMPKHNGFTNFTPSDAEGVSKINPTNSQIAGSLSGASLPFNTPVLSFSTNTTNWIVDTPVEVIPQSKLIPGHTYDIIATWVKINADQGTQTWTIPVCIQAGGVPAQKVFAGTSHNVAGEATGRYFTMRYGSVTITNVTPPLQFAISKSDMAIGTTLNVQVFRRN